MRALIKTASIPYPFHLKTPCNLCHQYHETQKALCFYCESLFSPLGPACTHCATPLFEASNISCGHCIKTPPPLDAVFATYSFEEPIRTLLHDFKYHEKLHLVTFFAEKMQLNPPKFNPNHSCFIPIPLHKKRLKTRGFNQAAMLAMHMAKQYRQPCLLHHVKKTKNTLPQAALKAKDRKKNIQNSFHITPVPYSEVILIDDLITTGSTANELAYQLKRQGTKKVSLWCIAKTCFVN